MFVSKTPLRPLSGGESPISNYVPGNRKQPISKTVVPLRTARRWTIPSRGYWCLSPDIKVSSGRSRMSNHREKAHWRTPTDCLSLPGQFLLDVVSTQLYNIFYICSNCFDLEASPEGHPHSAWNLLCWEVLPYQDFPRWFLLGAYKPWFGDITFGCYLFFSSEVSLDGSFCFAQHSLYREHQLIALRGFPIPAGCSECPVWWCFATYVSISLSANGYLLFYFGLLYT